MDNLKIKITDDMEKYNSSKKADDMEKYNSSKQADDMEKYNSSKKADARVLGELNLGNSHCLDDSALNKLCEALLELYPHDPVKLEISYSVGNH